MLSLQFEWIFFCYCGEFVSVWLIKHQTLLSLFVFRLLENKEKSSKHFGIRNEKTHAWIIWNDSNGINNNYDFCLKRENDFIWIKFSVAVCWCKMEKNAEINDLFSICNNEPTTDDFFYCSRRRLVCARDAVIVCSKNRYVTLKITKNWGKKMQFTNVWCKIHDPNSNLKTFFATHSRILIN